MPKTDTSRPSSSRPTLTVPRATPTRADWTSSAGGQSTCPPCRLSGSTQSRATRVGSSLSLNLGSSWTRPRRGACCWLGTRSGGRSCLTFTTEGEVQRRCFMRRSCNAFTILHAFLASLPWHSFESESSPCKCVLKTTCPGSVEERRAPGKIQWVGQTWQSTNHSEVYLLGKGIDEKEMEFGIKWWCYKREIGGNGTGRDSRGRVAPTSLEQRT